jgi:hypothetical protein
MMDGNPGGGTVSTSNNEYFFVQTLVKHAKIIIEKKPFFGGQ